MPIAIAVILATLGRRVTHVCALMALTIVKMVLLELEIASVLQDGPVPFVTRVTLTTLAHRAPLAPVPALVLPHAMMAKQGLELVHATRDGLELIVKFVLLTTTATPVLLAPAMWLALTLVMMG